MLIGAQAFQETPKSHAPAVIIALVPQVAAWGKRHRTAGTHWGRLTGRALRHAGGRLLSLATPGAGHNVPLHPRS